MTVEYFIQNVNSFVENIPQSEFVRWTNDIMFKFCHRTGVFKRTSVALTATAESTLHGSELTVYYDISDSALESAVSRRLIKILQVFVDNDEVGQWTGTRPKLGADDVAGTKLAWHVQEEKLVIVDGEGKPVDVDSSASYDVQIYGEWSPIISGVTGNMPLDDKWLDAIMYGVIARASLEKAAGPNLEQHKIYKTMYLEEERKARIVGRSNRRQAAHFGQIF